MRNAAEFITRTVTVPLIHIPLIVLAKGQEVVWPLTLADMVIDPEPVPLPPAIGSLGGAVVGDILIGNRYFGQLEGVEVLQVATNSPAYWVGLQAGDIIVTVDNGKTRSSQELIFRVARAAKDFPVAIMRHDAPGLIRASR